MKKEAYIVFKKYGQLWAIPVSKANKPQVKRLLESSIIVEAPSSLFGKPKVYKVRKARRKIEKKPKTAIRKIEKRVGTVLKKRTRRSARRPMPLGLQRYNLERLARKYGVSPDLIDWEALIDPTLTYSENKTILEKKIKELSGNTDLILEEIPLEKLDYEYRKFIEDLIWKWEAGDTKDLEMFGIDPKKIKSKEDLLKILL